MRQRHAGPVGLVALALSSILATASVHASHPGRQAAPTPMELFAKLLPVIRHDRCSNCHGDVNPTTGRDHMGGEIDPARTPCQKCHMKGWSLPGESHFFPPKTDREVCGLFSDFAAKQGHRLFITNHLRGDELIVAAFAGRMGGVGDMGGFRDSTNEPEPPPMNQDAFITLAEDWLNRGQAACDVEGTITLIETVSSNDFWHMVPYTDDRVEQHGTRTVTITLSAGKYHADVKVEGSILGTHIQHLSNAQGQPCTVTMTTSDHYSGTTNGPATVTAKDTAFFGDTNPALGQRDYRIDVTLPAEHTRRSQRGNVVNGCGALTPSPEPADLTLDWDPSSFTLEGHLDDPRTVNLVGSCDRTLKSKDVGVTKSVAEMSCNRFANMGNEESPWLMNQADVALHDGSEVTFRVQSFWNIRYRK
jgi:hypothetical protein